MRGGLLLLVVLAILVVTVVMHVRRGRLRRARPVPLGITAAAAPTGTARAAAEVLAALDSRPAGVPLGSGAPEDGVRQLFVLRPASLLVPFDDPGGGGLRGVSVAHGTFVVTNRHLRFEADDAEDVVWPVGDIRELVVVPEGLFIRALGRSTQRGVGAGPEWVGLLPLLVEWASALHGDDPLDSVRTRVGWLAQGSPAA